MHCFRVMPFSYRSKILQHSLLPLPWDRRCFRQWVLQYRAELLLMYHDHVAETRKRPLLFKCLRFGNYLLLQHDLVCPDLYIRKIVIRNAIWQNNSNSKADHPSSQISHLCLLFHKILKDPRSKTLVLISWNKADDIKHEITFHH